MTIAAFLCWCLIKRRRKGSFTYHRSAVVGPPFELDNSEKKRRTQVAELDGDQQLAEAGSNQINELPSVNSATEPQTETAEISQTSQTSHVDAVPNPEVVNTKTRAEESEDVHQDATDELAHLQEEVARIRAQRERLEELEALRAREAELERQIEEMRRRNQ